jgi:hypothetical protein
MLSWFIKSTEKAYHNHRTFKFLSFQAFVPEPGFQTVYRLGYGLDDLRVGVRYQVWGEVSMCRTPPTLIWFDLLLVHHFIEGTDIDTTDIHPTTFLILLVLVQSNYSTPRVLPSIKWCTSWSTRIISVVVFSHIDIHITHNCWYNRLRRTLWYFHGYFRKGCFTPSANTLSCTANTFSCSVDGGRKN